MNLLANEEQTLVGEATARALESAIPFRRLFGMDPARFMPGRSDTVAAEMGWYGLSLPEADGGIGYTIIEEIFVGRALGRSVAPVSILATALAARLAHEAGAREIMADLISGKRLAGFAITLSHSADKFLLLDSDRVAFALVLYPEPALYAVNLSEMQVAAFLDPTIRAATIPVSREPMLRSGSGAIGDRARLLIAAQLTGLGERACELAVEHAKTRVQFGRPIGAFQAIKHRCAAIASLCEGSWAQVCASAAASNEAMDDAAVQIAAAYSVAEEASIESIRTAIQAHGAIAITDEHALHVLLKRHHVLVNLGAGCGLDEILTG